MVNDLIVDSPKEWVLEYTLNGEDVQRETMICTQKKAVAYANNHCGYFWTLSEKGSQSLITPQMEADMAFIAKGAGL